MSDLKFENGYVTFMDVLGFSDLVASVDDGEQLARFQELVVDLETFLDEFSGRFGTGADMKGKEALERTSTEIVWVSDSIVVSSIDNPDFPELALGIHGVLAILLWQRLLRIGFLLRGGTASGTVCRHTIGLNAGDTNRLLFGSAFIKAYNLEKNADHPIIVLDEDCASVMQGYNGMLEVYWADNSINPPSVKRKWKTLSDEYLKPQEYAIQPYDSRQKELDLIYGKVKNSICDGLGSFANNKRALDKWIYAAKHFNREVSDKGLEGLVIDI